MKRIRLLKDLGPGCLEGTEHDVISEERIPPAAHEPPGGRLVRAFFYSGGGKLCAALPDEFEYVED